ncbi:MAG: 16S rRNA (adenine(1518)-N(6)/adenine(1519)-N(6))-dimethyltransferase RsmA [Acidimicrobiales bacterium]
MTLSRSQVLDLMARHEITPSRALGQNFVVDPNTTRRIARLAGVSPGESILEIGAGLGSLTLALAEAGGRVTAVEMDRRLIGVLGEVAEPAGVRVIHGDAMALDWGDILDGEAGPWKLVANLPYNVATPLVIDLLEGVPLIEEMLVMVQREVGERLAAGVGQDGYGAVSVKVAYWAVPRLAGRVPASVFLPKPKVESVLVSIRRHPAPPPDLAGIAYADLFGLVKAGFAHRRKMLRRSLDGLVRTEDFVAAGVRGEDRAEDLDLASWGRLATAVARR